MENAIALQLVARATRDAIVQGVQLPPVLQQHVDAARSQLTEETIQLVLAKLVQIGFAVTI